jgi:hypothetical protein
VNSKPSCPSPSPSREATSRSIGRPEEASHAVREYLAALDTARRDEESGGGDGSGSGGSKPPKQISLTDPQAAWVARKDVDPFFAYDANYLIDNKFGIILDAEGTRANCSDEMAIAGEPLGLEIEAAFDTSHHGLGGSNFGRHMLAPSNAGREQTVATPHARTRTD